MAIEINNLNLCDVRFNNNNIYKEVNITELADSILQYGQLENATVYVDETPNDGKKFTLVGGHRRYLALSYLAERGAIEPIIKANIIEKPNQLCEEQMLIVADNQQRTKDDDTRLKEILYANNYWNYLVSINQKPHLEHGQKKRDWIAKKTGYCARTVQNILTEIKNREMPTVTVTTNTSVASTSLSDEEKAIKEIRKSIKNLKRACKFISRIDDLSDYNTMIDEEIQNLQRIIGGISPGSVEDLYF